MPIREYLHLSVCTCWSWGILGGWGEAFLCVCVCRSWPWSPKLRWFSIRKYYLDKYTFCTSCPKYSAHSPQIETWLRLQNWESRMIVFLIIWWIWTQVCIGCPQWSLCDHIFAHFVNRIQQYGWKILERAKFCVRWEKLCMLIFFFKCQFFTKIMLSS